MSKEDLLNHYINLQRLESEGQPVDDALLETEQELFEEVEQEADQDMLDGRRSAWSRFWNEAATIGHWDESPYLSR